ncbi:MAG: ABC transporter ATP-binding protein [Capsulimonadaceae bacterium]|nr:ABC transporter ATP-binding protein [Capsulimonadaceae bacterium]
MSHCRLVVEGIVKAYENLEVLKGVTFSVAAAESVAIAGPSGSGKSTLLNIIGALDRADSGSVTVEGVDIASLSARGRASYRASEVGFVFQDHHLLPQLTAVENILIASLAAGKGDGQDRAMELLGRVGLKDRAGAFPAQLSGGERQRVAVARALMNQPRLLLCDEPTGSLDASNGDSVLTLILDLAKTTGAAMVLVTHNAAHASRCDRLLAMRDGVLAG